MPDEVYVKLALFSVEHHRLVPCIYAGGSGSCAEPSLDYHSVIWRKTSFSSTPVFGDLVRLNIPVENMKDGYVQFTVMAVDKGLKKMGETFFDERVILSGELPVTSAADPEIWLEDGEHEIFSAGYDCSLLVRCSALVPLGHRDSQVASALKEPVGDLPLAKILQLRYAAADELKRCKDVLTDHLICNMMEHLEDQEVQKATLDVLALLASYSEALKAEDLARMVPSEQASLAVLEAIRLALLDTSRRNAIIKSLPGLCHMFDLEAVFADDSSEVPGSPRRQLLLEIQLELMDIAFASDTPVSRMLVLKHWPLEIFGDAEDLVCLLDGVVKGTIGEYKTKINFMLEILQQATLSSTLVICLWRNLKPHVQVHEQKKEDTLPLALNALIRLLDHIALHKASLNDALDVVGPEMLSVLMKCLHDLSKVSGAVPFKMPSCVSKVMPWDTKKSVDLWDLHAVSASIRALIIAVVNLLGDDLNHLALDLGESERSQLYNALREFLSVVSLGWYRNPTIASFRRMEGAALIKLCAIGTLVDKVDCRPITFATVASLVTLCDIFEEDENIESGIIISDVVKALETASRGEDRLQLFTQLIDLSSSTRSTRIRETCQECLVPITQNGSFEVSSKA